MDKSAGETFSPGYNTSTVNFKICTLPPSDSSLRQLTCIRALRTRVDGISRLIHVHAHVPVQVRLTTMGLDLERGERWSLPRKNKSQALARASNKASYQNPLIRQSASGDPRCLLALQEWSASGSFRLLRQTGARLLIGQEEQRARIGMTIAPCHGLGSLVIEATTHNGTIPKPGSMTRGWVCPTDPNRGRAGSGRAPKQSQPQTDLDLSRDRSIIVNQDDDVPSFRRCFSCKKCQTDSVRSFRVLAFRTARLVAGHVPRPHTPTPSLARRSITREESGISTARGHDWSKVSKNGAQNERSPAFH
jgi:ubiquitin